MRELSEGGEDGRLAGSYPGGHFLAVPEPQRFVYTMDPVPEK